MKTFMVSITGPDCDADILTINPLALNINMTNYWDSTDDMFITWSDSAVTSALDILRSACGGYVWKFTRNGVSSTTYID